MEVNVTDTIYKLKIYYQRWTEIKVQILNSLFLCQSDHDLLTFYFLFISNCII